MFYFIKGCRDTADKKYNEAMLIKDPAVTYSSAA